MKILVLGHAGHGKDTVASIIANRKNFKFASATEIACKEVIYPALKGKHGWECWEQALCLKDEYRQEYKEVIDTYCKEDKIKLVNLVLQSSDIYCGLRSLEQYNAAMDMDLFDFVIYVTAPKRVGTVDNTMELSARYADFIIVNDGTIAELRKEVDSVVTRMYLERGDLIKDSKSVIA